MSPPSTIDIVSIKGKQHSEKSLSSWIELTRCFTNVCHQSSGANAISTDHGRFFCTMDTAVSEEKCLEILGCWIRNWSPTHEAIRSYVDITLLPVHGDSLSCLLQGNDTYAIENNSKPRPKYSRFSLSGDHFSNEITKLVFEMIWTRRSPSRLDITGLPTSWKVSFLFNSFRPSDACTRQ